MTNRSFPDSGSGDILIKFRINSGYKLTADWCVILFSFHFVRFIFDKNEMPAAMLQEATRGALQQYNADELEPLSCCGLEALLIQVH